MIPTRSVVVLMGAIFFIFAPLSILLVSSFEQQRPVSSTIFLMLVSGMVAVCWAVTFTLFRWFAIGIVVFSLALALFSGPLRFLPLGAHRWSAQARFEVTGTGRSLDAGPPTG